MRTGLDKAHLMKGALILEENSKDINYLSSRVDVVSEQYRSIISAERNSLKVIVAALLRLLPFLEDFNTLILGPQKKHRWKRKVMCKI